MQTVDSLEEGVIKCLLLTGEVFHIHLLSRGGRVENQKAVTFYPDRPRLTIALKERALLLGLSWKPGGITPFFRKVNLLMRAALNWVHTASIEVSKR